MHACSTSAETIHIRDPGCMQRNALILDRRVIAKDFGWTLIRLHGTYSTTYKTSKT